MLNPDDPNPIDIHWSQAANHTFSHSILKAPALEMNVVVNCAARVMIQVPDHNSFLSFSSNLAEESTWARVEWCHVEDQTESETRERSHPRS